MRYNINPKASTKIKIYKGIITNKPKKGNKMEKYSINSKEVIKRRKK